MSSRHDVGGTLTKKRRPGPFSRRKKKKKLEQKMDTPFLVEVECVLSRTRVWILCQSPVRMIGLRCRVTRFKGPIDGKNLRPRCIVSCSRS